MRSYHLCFVGPAVPVFGGFTYVQGPAPHMWRAEVERDGRAVALIKRAGEAARDFVTEQAEEPGFFVVTVDADGWPTDEQTRAAIRNTIWPD